MKNKVIKKDNNKETLIVKIKVKGLKVKEDNQYPIRVLLRPSTEVIDILNKYLDYEDKKNYIALYTGETLKRPAVEGVLMAEYAKQGAYTNTSSFRTSSRMLVFNLGRKKGIDIDIRDKTSVSEVIHFVEELLRAIIIVENIDEAISLEVRKVENND